MRKSELSITDKLVAKYLEKDFKKPQVKSSNINVLLNKIEFNKCKKRKKIVEKEILDAFPDLTNVSYGEEREMWSDADSKQITTDIYLNTSSSDGGAIRIICVDRSKRVEEEKGWVDSLRVIVNSKDFNIFIKKNASLND